MAHENLFDGLQSVAFDVVATAMGYVVTWQPSGGNSMQAARALFKNPTEGRKLGEQEYDPYRYTMEYRRGELEGLKQNVDYGNTEEITISGTTYYVRKVDAKFDGKTMVAVLELKQ